MTDRDVVNLIGIAGLSLAVFGLVLGIFLYDRIVPTWVAGIVIGSIAFGVAGCTGGCAADQYYKEKGKVQNGAKIPS